MKNDESSAVLAGKFDFLYAVLAIVGFASTITTSIVGSWLWEWFLSPLGLPLISPWHMAGLVMFFWVLRPDNMLTHFFTTKAANLSREDEVTSSIAVWSIVTAMTWMLALFGYAVHSMM
jgi:hypothetical protein